MKRMKPIGIFLLSITLVLLAIGGLYGGILLMADPSGDLIGLPTSLLEGFPVDNFVLPGIFILAAFGIVPLVVLAGLWSRHRSTMSNRPVRTSQMDRSWIAAFGLSLALVVWIIIQILLIGFHHPVQIATGLLGLVMLALVLSVRRYFMRG